MQDLPSDEYPVKLLFVYDKTNVSRKYECPSVFRDDGVKDPRFVQNPWGNGVFPRCVCRLNVKSNVVVVLVVSVSWLCTTRTLAHDSNSRVFRCAYLFVPCTTHKHTRKTTHVQLTYYLIAVLDFFALLACVFVA